MESSYPRCSQGTTNTVCVWMSTLSQTIWHLLYVSAGCRYCACLRQVIGPPVLSYLQLTHSHFIALKCQWLSVTVSDVHAPCKKEPWLSLTSWQKQSRPKQSPLKVHSLWYVSPSYSAQQGWLRTRGLGGFRIKGQIQEFTLIFL